MNTTVPEIPSYFKQNECFLLYIGTSLTLYEFLYKLVSQHKQGKQIKPRYFQINKSGGHS
jgi:hypothetical protein